MQNRILQDILGTTSKFFDTAIEYPIEQEILLADYDRRIFKIIKTTIEHTITQKYINGNKLTAEGFFRINVFYRPPAGATLTVITKKIPFSKQFDLPEGPKSPHFINIYGSEQYINTRAVNPTRLEIRGLYNLYISGYAYKEIPVATAINSNSVCSDTYPVSCFWLRGSGSKQFSAESEISLPHTPEKILSITAKTANMATAVYEDKVNIKGEIVADICYTASDTPRIYHYNKTFLYNQVVDVPGIKENNVCYGDLHIINFTVTDNPNTKETNCIVTARADIQAFSKSEVLVVADRFSKKYEYEKQTAEIITDINMHSIYKNFSVSVEDSIIPGYEPVYTMADLTPPSFYNNDDIYTIKSKLILSVIMKNSRGEYECFSKNEDVYFSISENLSPQNEYVLTASVVDVAAAVSDDKMNAKVDISIKGFEICRSTLHTITSFTEDIDKALVAPAGEMILYYSDKGEKLFDIAMKYRADTGDIAKENNIEGKEITESRMLFIPVYGM